jgi:hypothetical protein
MVNSRGPDEDDAILMLSSWVLNVAALRRMHSRLTTASAAVTNHQYECWAID